MLSQQEQARVQQIQQDHEQVAAMVREAHQTVNNERQEARQYVGRLSDYAERTQQEQMSQAKQAETAKHETEKAKQEAENKQNKSSRITNIPTIYR